MKYQYIGKEHTFVRLSPNTEKVRIETGDIFESTANEKLFTTVFKKLSNDVEVTSNPIVAPVENIVVKIEMTEEEKIEYKKQRKTLIEQYRAKFNKGVAPSRTNDQILAKLAE